MKNRTGINQYTCKSLGLAFHSGFIGWEKVAYRMLLV